MSAARDCCTLKRVHRKTQATEENRTPLNEVLTSVSPEEKKRIAAFSPAAKS